MYFMLRVKWIKVQLERYQQQIQFMYDQINHYSINSDHAAYMLKQAHIMDRELVDMMQGKDSLKQRWKIHRVIHSLEQLKSQLFHLQESCHQREAALSLERRRDDYEKQKTIALLEADHVYKAST